MTKESSPPEHWEKLPRDKGSVLEARSKRAIAGLSGPDRIGRRPDAEATPLSLAQERLWFLDRLEPGTVVNNRPWGLHLTGPLDLPALESSLSEIVRTTKSSGPQSERLMAFRSRPSGRFSRSSCL